MQHTSKQLLLLLSMVVSLCGCGGLPGIGHTMVWKEEVKLHDGQVIVAERFINLGGYPTIESQNRSSLDETVTFNIPGSKSIVWKIDFRDSEPEQNSLNLIRFDVVKGVPYIATYPAGCIAYNKWGRPNPPQVFFKYEGEQWKRINLAELPTELLGANANVIVGTPDARIVKSYYTVAGVDSVNHDIQTPQYRSILREAVPSTSRRCGEMVYDGKGGWNGVGWFRKQPSYEACLMYCEQEKVPAQYCPCKTFFNGAEAQ